MDRPDNLTFYGDFGDFITLKISEVEKVFRDQPRNKWVGKGKLVLITTQGKTHIVRSEKDVLKFFPDIPWSRPTSSEGEKRLENRISVLADEISDLKNQIEELEKKIKVFEPSNEVEKL